MTKQNLKKKLFSATSVPYYQPMILSQNKNADGSWNVKFSISFNIKIINLTTFKVELFKDTCLSDDVIQTETITAADRVSVYGLNKFIYYNV